MTRMDIGYARVSTEEQNLDLQLQALEAAGCENIFEDQGISGAAAERPGLAGALSAAQSGDVVVVWKLDRLERCLPHLVETINGLRVAGVGFRSLQEQIDTTSAGGRFYLHILAALAEFERELIASGKVRAEVAALFEVDVATLRRALREQCIKPRRIAI
ncbi:MAG: hypothetical protein Kow0032_07890 [Methyloligellaceae bacterium]